MASNVYDVGSVVRVTATFKQNGVATDPSGTVTLKYLPPGGSIQTTTSLVHSGAGIYYFDIDTTAQAGRWRYRFVATGTGQAAQDAEFIVSGSALQ